MTSRGSTYLEKAKNLQGDKSINSARETGRYTGRSGETETNISACLDINGRSLCRAVNTKSARYD